MRPACVAVLVSRWCIAVVFGLAAASSSAQTAPPGGGGLAAYRALREFSLTGGSVRVDKLALKRDRAEMVFTGTIYFATPVDGRVSGAVFLGQGTFRAEVPPSRFERDNVHRLLGTDVVESDFQTAVLRFSDDTFDVIGKGSEPGTVPAEAAALASEFEGRILKETGVNIAARVAVSLLNREAPGFFFAQFDKGRRGRFAYVLDHQSRIPVANFGVNGGEKGVIYAYKKEYLASDVWMAFYALDDYARGVVNYSDAYNLVKTPHYGIDVDLRQPSRALVLDTRIDMTPVNDGVRAIPMSLSENLGQWDDARLKYGLRVRSAQVEGGGPVEFAQEDWEGGFTLLLPAPRPKGEPFTVELHIEGDFLRDVANVSGNHYPISNTAWYPRHGYLERSTFDLTFRHGKNLKVASVGQRIREAADPNAKNEAVTEYRIDVPVAIVSFALGPFERSMEMNDPKNGPEVPIEFYSMPMSIAKIQDKFILAEMMNSLNYFSALFGTYPYPVFRGAVHPYGFGQGLATLLLIPPTDRADRQTYSFIAHETSHQWWGHMVLWRSYRDQWLSEGFAAYSGMLYTLRRDGPDSAREMLREMRESLIQPPRTALGVGSGRLTDVGPIIMGHRLATRETVDAYSTLIYEKGALVLRMLHFLFSDPSTGNGQAFFDMMRDFVNRYQNQSASTDEFLGLVNEHFAKTPVARRFGLQDLNWFFRQWLFQTALPTYRMEYSVEAQPDKTYLVTGTVFQDGVPEAEKWFMPLPITIKLGGGKVGRSLVYALGPRAEFSLKIASKPESVELDPEWWVASEKTSTKAAKGK